ncbi:NAD(P)-binding protein [Suillus occidentalis]|nr:NAD(P)-binding protein [Suillus occidentalis]
MSPQKGIALITGSAQGIGRGIALRLARDGFDIALNDLPTKREQLAAVASEVEELGRKACIVIADVTIEEEVKNMINDTVKELSGLDVMVANAGIPGANTVLATTVEDWERTFTVNARGVFLCYKHAAVQMISQGHGGRIIGASSIAGKIGFPSAAAYCASKFAVRGLTQTAALELGKYNITVNAYAPGVIQTQLCAFHVNIICCLKLITFENSLIGNRPIKHNGQPEDIASIVSYLASKEAHFITVHSAGHLTFKVFTALQISSKLEISRIGGAVFARLVHTLTRIETLLSSMSQPKGTVIITGASQGIGRAIAVRLADDGFDIALNDIATKSMELHALSNVINGKGRRNIVVPADVSVEDEVRGMIATTVRVLGGVDQMIANAGIITFGNVLDADAQSFDDTFSVNVRGTFLCYKYAAQQMIEQGRGGRIIGASSVLGKKGSKDYIVYSSSKFAVRGLTQAAAMELGRHGITVNCYAPGPIQTEMHANQLHGVMHSYGFSHQVQTAVGYEGTPDDIASIVSYLVSKEAHFITGEFRVFDSQSCGPTCIRTY